MDEKLVRRTAERSRATARGTAGPARPVEVDTRPYSYNVAGAMAAFGLSRSRVFQLMKDDKVAVRYEGRKPLILGDSLRRYIDSLPSERP